MSTDVTLAEHLLFSPDDDTEGTFLNFVDGATESIFVCIFGFHLPTLRAKLIEKHQAGVAVSLLLDHSQAVGKAEQEEIQALIDAGVPFIIGTSEQHGAIMHLKTTVVDRAAVEHGSWNYSTSAHLQDNEMWITHNTDLARTFLQKYELIRAFMLMHDKHYTPAGAVPPIDALTDASPADAQAHIAARVGAGAAIIHRGHPQGKQTPATPRKLANVA